MLKKGGAVIGIDPPQFSISIPTALSSGKRLFTGLIVIFLILLLSSCNNIFFDFARKDHIDGTTDPGSDRHIEWIVIFDKNGGDTEAIPQMMAPPVPGETLSRLPAEPVRAGHIFTAWNTNPFGSGANFDLSSTVSARTTVYAQWEALSGRVIVNFAGNGARIEAHPRQMAAFSGSSLGGLPQQPQRDGYIFTGWNTAANGSGTPFDGSTLLPSYNLTVYAQWERPEGTHIVIFNSNEGTYVAPRYVLPGDPVLSPTNPSKTGYNFVRWNTGGGDEYAFGNPVHSDIILHAVWTPISYIVTYNSNGGTGSIGNTSHTYDLSAPLAAPVTPPAAGPHNLYHPNVFPQPTYIFAGWSTVSSGSGITYAPGQSVINLASTDGAVVPLYASWIRVYEDTHIVVFDTGGGAYTSGYSIVSDGGTLSQPSDPVRTGFILEGWYTHPTNRTSAYRYSFPGTVSNSFVLYANWELDPGAMFTITFDVNGGTGTAPTMAPVAINTPITLPLGDALNRTGHYFNGWNTNAAGTGTNYGAGTSFTVTDNTTLYARWVPYTLTINYAPGDGTVTGTGPASPVSAAYGTSVTMPSGGYSRTGYILTAWEVTGTGAIESTHAIGLSVPVTDLSTLIADSNATITLTAEWISSAGIGSGTATDPFIVHDIDTLRRVGRGTGDWVGDWSLSAHYRQTASVTLPDPLPGESSNFIPIGDNSTNTNASRFTGSYDGGPYGIFHLIINRPGHNYTGMFGAVGTGGVLKNITLSSANITGEDYTGALVGYLFEGEVEDSHVFLSETNDKVVGAHYTGGLVGGSYGNVDIEGNTVDISGDAHITGTAYVGGILGHNIGGIAALTNNHVNLSGAAHISGGPDANSYTGGMVGYIGGSGSSITGGSVILSGGAYISGTSITGGLAGYIGVDAVIRRSFALGQTGTSLRGLNNVGGLVGYSSSTGSGVSIENSFSNITVNATGNNTGGLLGFADNIMVTNSYAAGNVTGLNNVGGLVGLSNNIVNIEFSYAAGSVTGTGNAGGLVGQHNNGTINNSAALNPNVTGGSSSSTARIAGTAAGSLSNNLARVMTINGNLDYLVDDFAEIEHNQRHGESIVNFSPAGIQDHLDVMLETWWLVTMDFYISDVPTGSGGTSIWLFHTGGSPASHTLPTLRDVGSAIHQLPMMH